MFLRHASRNFSGKFHLALWACRTQSDQRMEEPVCSSVCHSFVRKRSFCCRDIFSVLLIVFQMTSGSVCVSWRNSTWYPCSCGFMCIHVCKSLKLTTLIWQLYIKRVTSHLLILYFVSIYPYCLIINRLLWVLSVVTLLLESDCSQYLWISARHRTETD